ncbi:DUF6173 family protein [Acinetobacter sp.]|uniref:DUF6173 family protein n=1 Tax=Acinetobacter sp. TaxID=472 RepID=UPI00334246D2
METRVLRANNHMQEALSNLRNVENVKEQRKHLHENPVAAIRGIIESQVRDFEDNLEDDYELGAWLASFGNQILIIVEQIQFEEPTLIIFKGRDNSGNKLQLIQHASQLNLLLNAVKKQTDEPRQQIGFIHN